MPTNWYNYVTATAGTIISENTSIENPASNTDVATESICPKGWVLPSRSQMRTIGPSGGGSSTYVSSFSSILGGYYLNSTLRNDATNGNWWGSNAYDGARRYYLIYNGSVLDVVYGGASYHGFYIRCVQAP